MPWKEWQLQNWFSQFFILNNKILKDDDDSIILRNITDHLLEADINYEKANSDSMRIELKCKMANYHYRFQLKSPEEVKLFNSF
mgnify:CR=1 FL=1